MLKEAMTTVAKIKASMATSRKRDLEKLPKPSPPNVFLSHHEKGTNSAGGFPKEIKDSSCRAFSTSVATSSSMQPALSLNAKQKKLSLPANAAAKLTEKPAEPSASTSTVTHMSNNTPTVLSQLAFHIRKSPTREQPNKTLPVTQGPKPEVFKTGSVPVRSKSDVSPSKSTPTSSKPKSLAVKGGSVTNQPKRDSSPSESATASSLPKPTMAKTSSGRPDSSPSKSAVVSSPHPIGTDLLGLKSALETYHPASSNSTALELVNPYKPSKRGITIPITHDEYNPEPLIDDSCRSIVSIEYQPTSLSKAGTTCSSATNATATTATTALTSALNKTDVDAAASDAAGNTSDAESPSQHLIAYETAMKIKVCFHSECE